MIVPIKERDKDDSFDNIKEKKKFIKAQMEP